MVQVCKWCGSVSVYSIIHIIIPKNYFKSCTVHRPTCHILEWLDQVIIFVFLFRFLWSLLRDINHLSVIHHMCLLLRCTSLCYQGSKVRPIWSHMRPNFSMVRLKKIWGRTGATSGSKRKKLCDSERPISWSKPIRDNEERDPPLIGRGPDIPVYSTSFKNARQNFAIFTGYNIASVSWQICWTKC